MIYKYQNGDTIQGNKYRKEGVQAQQYQEAEAARRHAAWLSRQEMRPVVVKKATRTEKIKGKKDTVKQVPRIIGMSGADPLLGFIAENYVSGKVLKGISQLYKALKGRQAIRTIEDLAVLKYTPKAIKVGKNLSQIQKKRSVVSKVNKELKKGIKENSILESYNKVPSNKDIGTAYDYLDFLDNIYPNSKLNATFYHGGSKGITQFKSAKELGSTNKGINSGTKDYGIYLADDKSLAQYYVNTHKKANRYLYNVRVNVQNPMRYETNNWYLDKFINTEDLRFSPAQITQKWYDRLNLKNYDGIYHTKSKNAFENGELVMLDGNNIHIMGTPEESYMFRKWKQNPQYSSKPLQEEIPLTPEQYDKSFLNYAKAAKSGLICTGFASTPLALVGYDNYQKSKAINSRKSKTIKKRSSSITNRKETSHNADNTTQFGITNYGFKNN